MVRSVLMKFECFSIEKKMHILSFFLETLSSNFHHDHIITLSIKELEMKTGHEKLKVIRFGK